MLTEKQIREIREHLEKAQNPLLFFDNDNDGLISFLLLRRFIDRGRGVAIKSFPELNVSYYRKVSELKPDYVFILDKPVVSADFLEKLKQDNIPVVWIDHHQVEEPVYGGVNYYNPFLNDKSNEPVSFLCYKITGRKEVQAEKPIRAELPTQTRVRQSNAVNQLVNTRPDLAKLIKSNPDGSFEVEPPSVGFFGPKGPTKQQFDEINKIIFGSPEVKKPVIPEKKPVVSEDKKPKLSDPLGIR